MLILKQRFPGTNSTDFFGGGTRWSGPGESLSTFQIWIENVTVHRNNNESLHAYLRRHYEKVSEQRARRFAEQDETAVELELVYDAPPAEFCGS